MSLYLLAIIGLAGLALLFILQNVAAVEVNFLLWTVSMSRALLIFITLVTGLLLGWFLHAYHAWRRAKRAAHGSTHPHAGS
jgi:lipopolysaccharide assembly protein A